MLRSELNWSFLLFFCVRPVELGFFNSLHKNDSFYCGVTNFSDNLLNDILYEYVEHR